jgi:hypothetical protein
MGEEGVKGRLSPSLDLNSARRSRGADWDLGAQQDHSLTSTVRLLWRHGGSVCMVGAYPYRNACWLAFLRFHLLWLDMCTSLSYVLRVGGNNIVPSAMCTSDV